MINNQFKSKLDIDNLLSRANQLKYWIDGSGVQMSYRQSVIIDDRNVFQDAIDEISTILGSDAIYLMVNRLPPKITVPRHTDTLKNDDLINRIQRYHLPLSTNDQCYFWEDENFQNLAVGYWHGPVEYWKPHSISNQGNTARIHLVVDLKKGSK